MNTNFSVAEIIGWPLLHFVWQGIVIGCIAALMCALLRNRRPETRYLVLCVALLICVGWPAFGIYQQVITPQAMGLEAALDLIQQSGGRFDVEFVKDNSVLNTLQNQLPLIVTIWLLGVSLMVARLVVGLLWVRQLGRNLLPQEQQQLQVHWQGRTRLMAQAFGLQRQVAFKIDTRLQTPVTSGCWQPVIVMPASLFSGMSPDLIEALLAHELAHIKRWDYLVNMAQHLALAFLFYHPAVWWISRRMDIEREQIADDVAAAVLGKPRALALALQKLDGWQSAPRMALAANGGHLLARIKRLMRPDQQAWRWTMASPVLGVILSCAAVSAVAKYEYHANEEHTQALQGTIQAQKSDPTAAPVKLLVKLNSAHAIVIDDASGQILLQKEADSTVPMASLSKLLTAMVVLDAHQNMQEILTVTNEDVVALKGASSHLKPGNRLTRQQMLEMTLIPSDNRAAQVLARTYPGGEAAFLAAAQTKIEKLGLSHMHMEEPTGYSKNNVASATDLARLTQVAMTYPELLHVASAAATSKAKLMASHGAKSQETSHQNTNILVGQKDWDIQISKTGFTRDAGRCILMHLNIAGKAITLVLLGASELAQRTDDIVRIREAIEQESVSS
ncbi:M56 family metallopeptidase [Undibacterium sp. Ji67W]|uniref:M56 family metallopeptidase n=1 Tax=Undibacterium sp. Ji67W TaxID=3413042 RepID=UPI003BF428B9